MNKDMMKSMGFEKEVELAELGYCPFCKEVITKGSFKDKLSEKEYQISGLCQRCQDEMFG